MNLLSTGGASRWNVRAWGWTALIVVLGALLRLNGIGYGLPALNDPDELMFELGAVRMLRTLSLNPGWFGHPAATTMDLLAVVNAGVFVAGWLTGAFATIPEYARTIYGDPTWVILPGRVAMAAFGVGSIVVVYQLASALFDRTTGLAAAAIVAVSPVHITYSQIIRSDMMASFFMLLCIAAALRIAQLGRKRDYVWAAVWLALAVATKWPFAMTGVAILGAAALRLREHPDERRAVLARTAACLALVPVFVLMISPYLLLDYPTVLANVRGEAQGHHLGATGGNLFENGWWYLSGPLFAGLGLVGFFAFLFGPVELRWRRELRYLLVPFAACFFILICSQHIVWERWALPLIPLAAILAAPPLVRLCRAAWSRLPRAGAVAAAALVAAVVLVPPAVRATRLERERTNDTRQRASHWLDAHVPAGSTILIEQFAFDLFYKPWGLKFPAGDFGCTDARATLQGRVSYASVNAARGTRSIIDYGNLAPAKRDTCSADYAIFAQYDRYLAEAAYFPAEVASYRALIAKGRVVATFAPEPGVSGGPVVRIVYIPRTPEERARDTLGDAPIVPGKHGLVR